MSADWRFYRDLSLVRRIYRGLVALHDLPEREDATATGLAGPEANDAQAT